MKPIYGLFLVLLLSGSAQAINTAPPNIYVHFSSANGATGWGAGGWAPMAYQGLSGTFRYFDGNVIDSAGHAVGSVSAQMNVSTGRTVFSANDSTNSNAHSGWVATFDYNAQTFSGPSSFSGPNLGPDAATPIDPNPPFDATNPISTLGTLTGPFVSWFSGALPMVVGLGLLYAFISAVKYYGRKMIKGEFDDKVSGWLPGKRRRYFTAVNARTAQKAKGERQGDWMKRHAQLEREYNSARGVHAGPARGGRRRR